MQTRHGSALQKVNDIDITTAELGLAYITPLDNIAGVVARFENGEHPGGITVGATGFDNSYRQSGVGVTTTWILSGHSRFDGRIDAVPAGTTMAASATTVARS